MNEQERAYLELTLVPGIGTALLARLTEHIGDARSILSARISRLKEVPGVGPKLADAIAHRDRERVDLVLQQCDFAKIDILFPWDRRFPPLLKELPDPPPLLYVQGSIEPRDQLSIAVVGTRHATTYGRQQAERLARGLSLAGITIVSGLARGIDAVAHEAALASGGRTLAVLGSGLIDIFPPEHAELAQRISGKQGAVISESPPHTPPRSGMFPHRNRIISGLSLGVLVIEAAQRSGALITARHAGEQGREVFALPGPVTSRVSKGCHQLIRDGAVLVNDTDDILEHLGPLIQDAKISAEETVRYPAELQLNDQEKSVLHAIDFQPTDIDHIAHRSQLPVQRVLSTLSVLEVRRLVKRGSGRTVQRL